MKDKELFSEAVVADVENDFKEVYGVISRHRQKVASAIDNEMLSMLWDVGGYVSLKLKSSFWGEGIVRQLSEYIRTQDSDIRGWSYRTIYKMVQFYDTYSRSEFTNLVEGLKLDNYIKTIPANVGQSSIVPFAMAQLQVPEIMPSGMAQMPGVLLATGWTNHQMILNRCRTDNERLFYIIYASHERLNVKQLERALKTDVMSSLLGTDKMQSDALKRIYPASKVIFKDTVYVDYLGLPKHYKEPRLRKGIVQHMKEFMLEVGKDLLFVDEEHILKVGGKAYRADLLFYHRLLQCMVVIELKTTEFRPAYKGQLEFYLEVLDKEERRSNENPSIGIIFCKESDPEVVRYALNRSMSPMMVMQYKEQLKAGGAIQRGLEEYCRFLLKEPNNQITPFMENAK